ncbi:MAG: hypothetical protein OXG29_10990 [Gammaproteobacteria bacterium]|nr:hypothetical protein [Gammaproteobacteria bacterium]
MSSLPLATLDEFLENLGGERNSRGKQDNRLEIMWGPDYSNRYDYLVFEAGQRIFSNHSRAASSFGKICCNPNRLMPLRSDLPAAL